MSHMRHGRQLPIAHDGRFETDGAAFVMGATTCMDDAPWRSNYPDPALCQGNVRRNAGPGETKMLLTGKSALITGSLGGIGFATEGTGRTGLRHNPEWFRRARSHRRPRGRTTGARRPRPPPSRRPAPAQPDRRSHPNHPTSPRRPRHPREQRRRTLLRGRRKFAPDYWDEALAVNLSAPFHAIRLALPDMRAKNWGRIVNMASIYGMFATVNRIDYITTKTALIGLTRAVALEVARTGITCNAICPGTVLTRRSTGACGRRCSVTAPASGMPRKTSFPSASHPVNS